MRKSIYFGLLLWGINEQVDAFELFHKEGVKTTEIISEHGMTCDQEGKQCTAVGHIQVTRGNGTLTCDKLVAHFGRTAEGKQELQRLEAFDNVHIFSQEEGYDATSSYTLYETEQERVTLRGNPIIKSKNIEIYGTGEVIYNQLENTAIAPQRSTAKKEDKLLQGDKLIVYFKTEGQEEDKKTTLDHMTAEGNVIVSTPEELARGDYGNYYEATNVAELWDNVVITRCDGQIRGQRARVDIESGRSQMIQESPDSATKERVQALLLPKEKQN